LEKIRPVCFVKIGIELKVRWRFFSKPAGPELESKSAAGDGSHLFLLYFFYFYFELKTLYDGKSF
jgi:hypothetical protein